MSSFIHNLLLSRPENPGQLHVFVKDYFGLHVPRLPIVAGHAAPFDYITHAFFDGGDALVWASRGGGKTTLGAAATLLDLMFKPGIQVRILGGSLVQSGRMYEALRQLLDRPELSGLTASEPTQRRVELVNGSVAELLAQSQRSVRGQRVHKLRCDEVEEFRDDVWRAAQMVTRSGECGGIAVPGSIEAMSTMHKPHGLMSTLIADAQSETANRRTARLFRWCALDVIENCPRERNCESCPLWADCLGKAKNAEGFVAIDDLIAQKSRISTQAWSAEMLCERPSTTDCVYPSFDPAMHVLSLSSWERVAASSRPGEGTGAFPVHSSAQAGRASPHPGPLPPGKGEGDSIPVQLIAGCDFGIRSPLVWLWALVRNGVVEVFDELVQSDVTFEKNLDAIESRGHGRPAWVGVDPAGEARNEQTGLSNVRVLRRRGYNVRSRRVSLDTGVELVRRRLDHGTLRIHPRCTKLIRALREYHFDPRREHNDQPIKDGPDHAADALRYLIVNLDATAPSEFGSYL